MNTETYLRQILRCETMIQNKLKEERRIRDMATRITPILDREPVQTFEISDPVGIRGAELVEISNIIERLQKKRRKIIAQIDAIEKQEYYEVLTYRYVQNMSINDISDKISKSVSQTCRRLNSAKSEFEKKYGNIYMDCE